MYSCPSEAVNLRDPWLRGGKVSKQSPSQSLLGTHPVFVRYFFIGITFVGEKVTEPSAL